jgi:hypothetical protein
MPFLGKRSVLEEILFDHFSTDVILERDWVKSASLILTTKAEKSLLVVDILAPKHNLAILTIKSSGAKLFRMFPLFIS